MSEKDLLMLGTVPLEAPEEVFQICGRTIGNSPALFSAEDQGGPVGRSRFRQCWTRI